MKEIAVGIAQPTFLPWAGWFDLLDQVDVFVILDDVAFSKQSWQQRNRLRSRDGLHFVSVPVKSAGRLGQQIVDTELVSSAFAEKLVRSVAVDYARAPYYRRYAAEFERVLRSAAASGSLVNLNCALIDWLSVELGVFTPRVRSSELAITGRRGEYVAKICEHLGAIRYLSPAGAEAYLIEDEAEFSARAVAVELQVYEHPSYRQCFAPFLPYASVLDLLLNEGDAAGEIMRSGRRPSRPIGAVR